MEVQQLLYILLTTTSALLVGVIYKWLDARAEVKRLNRLYTGKLTDFEILEKIVDLIKDVNIEKVNIDFLNSFKIHWIKFCKELNIM